MKGSFVGIFIEFSLQCVSISPNKRSRRRTIALTCDPRGLSWCHSECHAEYHLMRSLTRLGQLEGQQRVTSCLHSVSKRLAKMTSSTTDPPDKGDFASSARTSLLPLLLKVLTSHNTGNRTVIFSCLQMILTFWLSTVLCRRKKIRIHDIMGNSYTVKIRIVKIG